MSDDQHTGLQALLDDLVDHCNERNLPRVIVRDLGAVIISKLAPPDEAEKLGAQWQERWRETVRLEAASMRKGERS